MFTIICPCCSTSTTTSYAHPPFSIVSMYSYSLLPLTDNNHPILGKIVSRNFQIQRRRALPRSPRHVVMATMAGTEPSTEIAGLADRYAAEVGTHTQHDQPFWLLHAVFIFLGVAEGRDATDSQYFVSCIGRHMRLKVYILDAFGILDLIFCSVSDKDGLATPFNDHVFAEWDCGKIDLDFSLGEDVGGGSHVDKEI